ncbi:hypothetical protein L1987_45774 [Smallanthus sonchifolius]|uniref:Uncharacterized protein n=1 Tax=Smallanthus sonchifolius TaxID=185202 RepID=A0ACB9FXZ8_9ASTR|nr:hypothetical protein L1987_45774 [Smallanthus sonchifolius]
MSSLHSPIAGGYVADGCDFSWLGPRFRLAVMSLMAAISPGWGSDLGWFLIGPTNEDLSAVIKKVVFQGHSSFSNARRVVGGLLGRLLIAAGPVQVPFLFLDSLTFKVAVANFLPEVGKSFGPKPRKPKFAGHGTNYFSAFVAGHRELWSAQKLPAVLRKVITSILIIL